MTSEIWRSDSLNAETTSKADLLYSFSIYSSISNHNPCSPGSKFLYNCFHGSKCLFVEASHIAE
jgi:hypothetical protein